MPAETAGNRSHHLVHKRESFTHRAHKSDLSFTDEAWCSQVSVHKKNRPQVPVHKCRSPVHKCRPQMQRPFRISFPDPAASAPGFSFCISAPRQAMSRDGRFPSHRAGRGGRDSEEWEDDIDRHRPRREEGRSHHRGRRHHRSPSRSFSPDGGMRRGRRVSSRSWSPDPRHSVRFRGATHCDDDLEEVSIQPWHTTDARAIKPKTLHTDRGGRWRVKAIRSLAAATVSSKICSIPGARRSIPGPRV